MKLSLVINLAVVCFRRPVEAVSGGRLFALLLAAFLLAGPHCLPAWAAFRFTPFVRVESGFDDNVRLTQEARSDFYVTANPGFSLDWREPTSQLRLAGDLRYSEYYRLSEYTQVDGGNASLVWDYMPSPRWKFQLYDKFSSTYDSPEVDEQGRLVLVRGDSGRRDSNTAGAQVRHNFSPDDYVAAEMRTSQTSYTEEGVEDSRNHYFKFSGAHRLNVDWRADAAGFWSHSDYERSDDTNYLGGSASLVRALGPTMEAMLTLGYTEVKTITDDPFIRQSRDYKTYRAGLGFAHKVSPAFRWDAAAGWAYVDADREANQAAGDTQPVFSASASWSGQRWQLNANVFSSLGEQEVVGENLGLTLSHGMGVNYSYELSKHWKLSVNAAYVFNDYKQNTLRTGLQSGGDVESIMAGMALSWQFARRASLILDYRYLSRDSEDDRDDREQNRIFLTLVYEHPYRW